MRKKYPSILFLPILAASIVLFGTQKGRTASFYFHAYDGTLSIAWDPYTDGTATGFKLYYKVVDWNRTCGPPYDGTGLSEGDSPILYVIGVDIDPLNVLIHLFGATKGKKYCFVATAYNSQAESEYSNEDYKTFWEEWIAIAWENNSQVCPPADYDGDGKDDFAIKTFGGYYIIDMSNDHHLGYWNVILPAYGGYSAHPAPADYDGDGMADISVKVDDGRWLIDYADNGFGSWNDAFHDYGDASAHPAPADYDGDGKADLAVKVDDGRWLIDYASDGFGSWDDSFSEYGETSAHPAPADYDGDGKADLAVKVDDGRWLIDYASDGFGSWDDQLNDYGGSGAIPIPGDYDGDGIDDISVKVDDGRRLIDYAADGFGFWDDSFSGYGGGLSSKK